MPKTSEQTMAFFDLNIPYHESDKNIPDKSTRKSNRLKLTVKLMELGYSGAAYNRTIKGVMSESDRCATALFPLSSVLKLAPSLSAAVSLHRRRLGLPSSSPFRQYTRLTVAVDSPAQASALNSGNPILKTYDIVAVRPLNQNAFEQACQASEVDLIAIDFSEKLPFRLKQPMVKAAIQRGVYFEITYSGLIMNAQVRRQMISNAKLLVDWTRGKNIIFSSAAPSVTELRGPYDISNLSSLVGLSVERAKAALSKNCRSLIANALRKKQYYKEAIRVEVIPPGKQFDSMESWPDDWLKWDPISSGEGDLLLDDMARSFSTSSKVSKTVKAIDFTSIRGNLSSSGLQIVDLKSTQTTEQQLLLVGKKNSVAVETDASIAVIGQSQRLDSLDSHPLADCNISYDIPSQRHTYCSGESMKSFLPSETLRDFNNSGRIVTHTGEEELKNSNQLDVPFTSLGIKIHSMQPENITTTCDAHVIPHNHDAMCHTSAMDTEIAAACDVADAEDSAQPNVIKFSVFQNEGPKQSSHLDALSITNHGTDGGIVIEENMKVEDDFLLPSSEKSMHEDFMEIEQSREARDDPVSTARVLSIVESHNEIKDSEDHQIVHYGLREEFAMEEPMQNEHRADINYPTSVKRKVKQRKRSKACLLPFKRFLNPTPFKRKAQKTKAMIKLV
ncbi:protein GAMETOPHYTE DEFECTIVE 1 [Diospyros lotus]|uniref:protein GAMETOPHYTE DEFECTIVE 1 n=1 Tax=Diospyros lotus TaxID=55363 RepID=UPI002253FE51|nr:protein GAMETOPHYTE DEFECTIVE 1 [Diospyros lotus]XP_052179458.1 protein GAMETOPHYTE DEFECTIVE 1 [Diospyros lotus]